MPVTSLFTQDQKDAIQRQSAANLAALSNGQSLPYIQTLDVVMIGPGFDSNLTDLMFAVENLYLQIGVVKYEEAPSIFGDDILHFSRAAGDRSELETTVEAMTGKDWNFAYNLPASELVRETAGDRQSLADLRAKWIDVSAADWSDHNEWSFGDQQSGDGHDLDPPQHDPGRDPAPDPDPDPDHHDEEHHQ